MTNPVIVWIADLFGVNPAIIIILLTVVIIFSFRYFYAAFMTLFIVCKRNYEVTEGFESILWLIGAALLLLVVGPIYIIVNILFILTVISAANDFRDWWHKR